MFLTTKIHTKLLPIGLWMANSVFNIDLLDNCCKLMRILIFCDFTHHPPIKFVLTENLKI